MLAHFLEVTSLVCAVAAIASFLYGLRLMTEKKLFDGLLVSIVLAPSLAGGCIGASMEVDSLRQAQHAPVLSLSGFPSGQDLVVSSEVVALHDDQGRSYVVLRQLVPDSLLCKGNRLRFSQEALLRGEESSVFSGGLCPHRESPQTRH